MTCLATECDCYTQRLVLGEYCLGWMENGGMGVIFQTRCYSFDEHGWEAVDLCGLFGDLFLLIRLSLGVNYSTT